MSAPVANEWSTGLCSWCAPPSGCCGCMYAFWCTPCAYGSNVALLPSPAVICGGNCCGACCAYFGLQMLGFPCIIHLMTRGHIRNKYNIPGDGCKDFMITWCCTACALCQEYRELVIRGSGPGGVQLGAAQQQPPEQQQMLMYMAPAPAPPGPPQPVYAGEVPAATPLPPPQPEADAPTAQPVESFAPARND